MSFIKDPLYIIAVLLLLVVFAEWLGQKKFFKHLGAPLIVILAAAILANINIIPSSQDALPLYDGIFKYLAPLAIFFLLLDVRLKALRYAGLPMLIMFLIGAACTIAGTIIGYFLVAPQHHHVEKVFAVAGMYTGTYIGGSANLNAIALQYGVMNNGVEYAAINAVDNIATTLWIMATLILPPVLQKILPRKKRSAPEEASSSTEEMLQRLTSGKVEVTVVDISILLVLGLGTLFISNLINQYTPQIPSILILTTLALIFAQLPFVQKLKGGKIIGYLFVLLFLAVIGALCDINALSQSGEVAGTLLLWVGLIVLIHGILIFTIGGIFKQDWDIVSIASNANIGGATSAPVLATSLGRADLRLPGILVGSIGNAIGTYLGVLVAEFLK